MTPAARPPAGAPAGREPIVRVSCVRHTYPDRTIVHLCGLDFVVERGQRGAPRGSSQPPGRGHDRG